MNKTFQPNTFECRPVAGDCDVAEKCTGSSVDCPADSFQPNTVECRPVAGDCDLAENCTGSAAVCPADSFKANTVECRPIAGFCDLAENCTGSSAACPADSFKMNTVECRGAAGDCDLAENCTGSAAVCPADAFQPNTFECRAASGACNPAQNCIGTSVDCPPFPFYKDITINHAKVSGAGSHIDFPVLISLVDSDLHNISEPDGSDIAFYSGATLLDFEIESFDQNYTASEARLVAWVRIPSLSTASDTVIRMYYHLLPGSWQNATGVWDGNYNLVWHLNRDSGNQVLDSTSNNFAGDLVGGPTIVEGKIGKSVSFDGIDDHLPTTHTASELGVSGNAARTFGVWTQYDGLNSEYGTIFGIGPMCGGGCLYQGFGIMESKSNATSFMVGGEWSQNAAWVVLPNGSPNNVWVYYVAVYDGNQKIYVYVNGSLVVDATLGNNTYTSLVTNDGAPFGIGLTKYLAKGVFDEMRVSAAPHSADWIVTEYNNQSDPNSFYTVSSQVGCAP